MSSFRLTVYAVPSVGYWTAVHVLVCDMLHFDFDPPSATMQSEREHTFIPSASKPRHPFSRTSPHVLTRHEQSLETETFQQVSGIASLQK